MKKEKVRSKMIVVRLNDDEWKLLQSLFSKSICRTLSSYLRKTMLQKPVVLKYRNESADEILSALINVKNELNAIGNNLNQAVHKLHTLDRIPEFRYWVNTYENTRRFVEEKVAEIKERMNQLYLQWSQK